MSSFGCFHFVVFARMNSLPPGMPAGMVAVGMAAVGMTVVGMVVDMVAVGMIADIGVGEDWGKKALFWGHWTLPFWRLCHHYWHQYWPWSEVRWTFSDHSCCWTYHWRSLLIPLHLVYWTYPYHTLKISHPHIVEAFHHPSFYRLNYFIIHHRR